MNRSSAIRLLTASLAAPLAGCGPAPMTIPRTVAAGTPPTSFGAQLYALDDLTRSLTLIAAGGGTLCRYALTAFDDELANLDTLFATASRLGIHVILCSQYASQPVDLPSYIAYAVSVQQRYASYAPSWEIWNEPDLQSYWGATPNVGDYSRLAVATGKALFSAGAAQVWSGGTSEIDVPWIIELVKNGVYDTLNGCAVHAYEDPGQAYDKYLTLQGGILPKGIALHTTETGVPSAAGQVDFLTNMWYVHRQLALSTMVWLEFRDGSAGTSGFQAEPYGLVTSAYVPKPPYATARTLIAAQ